ncbi:SH3 domain-binding protein 1-like isoform X2 [Antechinus flavipes]|uniref:SH3 domain-binding protein 1-like isoform X2 n=1 Tax=Antechinus flavipes TaxID=38775 RepID=UPI0022367206|nr:SH3 domain-binding protein 1-like isoform X2 [Antechinus flavipes]
MAPTPTPPTPPTPPARPTSARAHPDFASGLYGPDSPVPAESLRIGVRFPPPPSLPPSLLLLLLFSPLPLRTAKAREQRAPCGAHHSPQESKGDKGKGSGAGSSHRLFPGARGAEAVSSHTPLLRENQWPRDQPSHRRDPRARIASPPPRWGKTRTWNIRALLASPDR